MKLFIFFACILIVYSKLASGNFESDPGYKAALERLISNQFEDEIPELQGKSEFDPPERKKLPTQWASLVVPYSNVQESCGITLNIARTYIKFSLNSEDKPCRYDFIGSIKAGCTVSVLCDKVVTFKPPKSYGSPESCVDEYFRLSDGTTGNITGCGNFVFNKMPRYARNGGRDIYLIYKGKSPNSTCIAFCKEDLNDSYTDILPPKPLSRYRKFRGFSVPEDSPSCECGKRNNQQGRIVGGEEAKRFEFPWLGGLVYKKYQALHRIPICGGALITDKHVLTAAHCLYREQHESFAMLFHAHVMDKYPNTTGKLTAEDIEGIESWDLPKETDATEQSVRVEVESFILHPLYNNITKAFDVALLTLKDRVSFADRRVLPICLPGIDERLKFKGGKTTFTVAGWGSQREGQQGSPRALQKIDAIPYISQTNCESFAPAPHTHMCAGFLKEGGKSTCQGDSGGPLAYNINAEKNQYAIVGIVSAGVGCARPLNPTMFTKMQEVVQWIYYNTANTDAFWCGR